MHSFSLSPSLSLHHHNNQQSFFLLGDISEVTTKCNVPCFIHPLPPLMLRLELEVSPGRDHQESDTDENTTKFIGERKALLLLMKETPENRLRCHNLYSQTVE